MTDKTDKVTLPAHVTMQTIESSHHSRFGYDPEGQHLYIDFAKPGQEPKVYRYSNVTAADHQAYLDAESKGKHVIHTIKPQAEKFPFVKVSNEP